MTMRRLIPTLALTVAVGAALSGCVSNPGADPPPTIATASGYTPATTPSPTTTDPATKERLDRQNAEDIWHQFNALLFSIESLPADQVEPAIAAVAVDPIASRFAQGQRPVPGAEQSRLRGSHLLDHLAAADQRRGHRGAHGLPGRLPGRDHRRDDR